MKRSFLSVTTCALAFFFVCRAEAQRATLPRSGYAQVAAAWNNSEPSAAERSDQKLRKRETPESQGPDNRYCATGDLPKFGTNDGPAELPRVCIYTAREATPSPGKIIQLGKEESLDQAIDHASCGDVIELQAGVTYTGLTAVPAKPCDEQHWITVRTSAWRSLPPEGTRLTPCYAGVASLKGRPAYSCSHPDNVMAKLLVTTIGGDTHFVAGANHYRFIGIEFTRAPGIGAVADLVRLGTAKKIIFDQTWFHGDDDSSGEETKRGIDLGQSYLVAVLDSYFNDFYCISVVGSCTDAQAVLGGLGTPSGNWGGYKIVNNFLEASGENILFGGGEATASPSDIEVRRNHFFKPFLWMSGSPSYDGGAAASIRHHGFSARNISELKQSMKALLDASSPRADGGHHPLMVKNLFELKSGCRVLLEGNVLENVWGGFSQAGSAILLTPKSQNGQCPACFVSDVTVRYNLIHKAGRVLEVANVMEEPAPGELTRPSAPGHNYSIHDIVADGLQYFPGCYGSSCSPYFNEFLTSQGVGGLDKVLHDVKIEHITEVLDNHRGTSMMALGGPVGALEMYNFAVQNSIIPAGEYGIMSGDGGCASGPRSSVPKLQACFRNATFNNNAIPFAAAGAGGDWAKGNFLVVDQNQVGFVSLGDRDYHLAGSSRYKKKGTDGKDVGADIDAVDSVTLGVE